MPAKLTSFIVSTLRHRSICSTLSACTRISGYSSPHTGHSKAPRIRRVCADSVPVLLQEIQLGNNKHKKTKGTHLLGFGGWEDNYRGGGLEGFHLQVKLLDFKEVV